MSLDLADIQRLVLDGYASLPHSVFEFLRIRDADRARRWLRARLARVGTAADREAGDRTLAVAFSAAGLRAIGADPALIARFPLEYQQGTCTAYRARLLGDEGESAPEHWRWGGPAHPVHMLLGSFAHGAAEGDEPPPEFDAESGLQRVDRLVATAHAREPFGFRDGISQPFVVGSDESTPGSQILWNRIQPGEFLLGYPNQLGELPASPWVEAAADPEGTLADVQPGTRELPHGERPAPDPGAGPERDFGRNGSFLVARELQQDVDAFGLLSEREAALLVGRWRDGTPLHRRLPGSEGTEETRHAQPDPKAEVHQSLPDAENDFTYYSRDPDGLLCPPGAHVRRAFPRDALTDPQRGVTAAAQALEQANLHRILRRGRSFRRPPQDGEPACVGLFFLCLNANIERQFEFVQHHWLQNTGFDELWGESDPLVGRGPERRFTVPEALGTRSMALRDYVTVRGSEYFFLPGLRALRFLLGPRGTESIVSPLHRGAP